MALIVDASALYGQADATEPTHSALVRLLDAEPEPRVTSEAALAEADYLIYTRLGIDAELTFLDDLANGLVTVTCLSQNDLTIARDLAYRYRDLGLGFADCSLVVLARRYQTRRVATLNHRHFRAVTALQGGAFTILPADL